MKRIIIAAVAAAAVAAPAFAQQNPPNPQSPPHQAQSQQPGPGSSQNAAQIRPIAPDQMSTTQVRQVQQALDNKGFKAGRTDGKWGPETETALKDFQKSKNISANGQLDHMTMTALGLNPADFGTGRETTGQAPQSGSGSQAPQQGSGAQRKQ